jgi:hypothetical protein
MSMSFLTINPSDSRRAAEASGDIRRTVTGRDAWRSTVVRTYAHEGVDGLLQAHFGHCSVFMPWLEPPAEGGSLRWSSGYAIATIACRCVWVVR